jgi:hypothetical protein
MFSELGPLFRTTFRQAESNDTRQGIPHDERDRGRKKREEDERQAARDEAWVDDTSVSITALRSFLLDFLKTLPEAQDYVHGSGASDKPAVYERPREPRRPTSTRNARAVRAYQTMARRGQEAHVTPPPPPPASKGEPPGAGELASSELRTIYTLIEQIDALQAQGVSDLHIKPAESFLQSLSNAVAVEQSKI